MKVVPMDIVDLLNPLALTVWFMDDGAADHAGVTFQTHNFTSVEVVRLNEALKERFDLATTIRSNRGREVIYIKASSIGRLEEVLAPHLLRGFSYKLRSRRTRTP